MTTARTLLKGELLKGNKPFGVKLSVYGIIVLTLVFVVVLYSFGLARRIYAALMNLIGKGGVVNDIDDEDLAEVYGGI